jgi:AcrR family transcriptional regulator
MASERIAAKRAALRQRIIEVALEAFAARGFEATTTVDIADTLQMTGPSLYHYFRTKEELLFACMDFILEQLHTDVSAAATSAGTVRERMERVVRAQLKVELGSGGAASLVNAHLYGPQYLTQVLTPERSEALRQRQRTLVKVFVDLISEGAASAEFSVADARIAAFNVLAVVQYSGVWYRPRRGQRLADLIDAQVSAVMQLLGIAPTPSAAASAPAPARSRRHAI